MSDNRSKEEKVIKLSRILIQKQGYPVRTYSGNGHFSKRKAYIVAADLSNIYPIETGRGDLLIRKGGALVKFDRSGSCTYVNGELLDSFLDALYLALPLEALADV